MRRTAPRTEGDRDGTGGVVSKGVIAAAPKRASNRSRASAGIVWGDPDWFAYRRRATGSPATSRPGLPDAAVR